MRKPRLRSPCALNQPAAGKRFPRLLRWFGLHKCWDYVMCWGRAHEEEAERQLADLDVPINQRSWRHWLGKLGDHGTKKARKRWPRLQPSLEMLEERRMPSQAYPYVESINRSLPSGTTAAAGASFTVIFSEAVTGVAASDFSVPKTGSVNNTGSLVVSGSGTTYTVLVSGITGTGSLGLNLVDNNSIRDDLGHALV